MEDRPLEVRPLEVRPTAPSGVRGVGGVEELTWGQVRRRKEKACKGQEAGDRSRVYQAKKYNFEPKPISEIPFSSDPELSLDIPFQFEPEPVLDFELVAKPAKLNFLA